MFGLYYGGIYVFKNVERSFLSSVKLYTSDAHSWMLGHNEIFSYILINCAQPYENIYI